MMDRRTKAQDEMILYTMEQLVPEDHFLRELEAALDMSFVYDQVAHLYSERGRRSIDPVILVKMLLLGYFYGIESERKLEKEVQVNVAFRWYLGLSFEDRVPDHSTISQNRRRRFGETNLYQVLFDEVVRQCIALGLVDGKRVLMDSTHIKANADNDKSERVMLMEGPDEYWRKLEAAAIVAEGERKEKKAGREPGEDSCISTRIETKSTTDPDCGLLKRTGKPGGFHYLLHQSADSKYGIITDVHVTAGNVPDHMVCVDRIKAQMERYDLPIEEVGGDAGYDYIRVHAELAQMGIAVYTPDRDQKDTVKKETFTYRDFRFDRDTNTYLCPAGQRLSVMFYQRRHDNIARIYRCSVSVCQACALREKCLTASNRCRTLSRTMNVEYMDNNHLLIGSDRYREIQMQRRVLCEGNHATLKREHCLRRAGKRGTRNVTEQCLLAATALDIKKMIKYRRLPLAMEGWAVIRLLACEHFAA